MKKHFGKVIENRNTYNIIECKSCSFIHQSPLPNEEEIEDLYKNNYYQYLKPSYLRDAEKRDLFYRKFMATDVLRTVIKLRKSDKPGKVLDVGCSTGVLLSIFKKAGWDAWGVEPFTLAADMARKRGAQILSDRIETVDIKSFKAHFDFIYVREVLDHLIQPIEVMKNIYKLLKPKGIIYIETGNEFNPLQEAYVKKNSAKRWWLTDDHISYFNKDSLLKLLKNTRLKQLHAESTFPLEFFLFMELDYIKDKSLGPKIHEFRKNFELTLKKVGLGELRGKIYENYYNLGIGRNIIVYAQKK